VLRIPRNPFTIDSVRFATTRKNTLKSAALAFLLVARAAMALHAESPINTASELRDWCKEESEAALIGRGMAPANWTARYWDQVDTLMVKGQWRVNGADYTVECTVARGAQARFASMSIQEPSA
jgi:hypothetical protein